MGEMSFHLIGFHVNTENEGLTEVADYVKETCLNAYCTCTCIMIIFPHSTNHIIDLWPCCCLGNFFFTNNYDRNSKAIKTVIISLVKRGEIIV